MFFLVVFLDINWTEIFTFPPWDRSYTESYFIITGKITGMWAALFLNLSPTLTAKCILSVDYAACGSMLSCI